MQEVKRVDSVYGNPAVLAKPTSAFNCGNCGSHNTIPTYTGEVIHHNPKPIIEFYSNDRHNVSPNLYPVPSKREVNAYKNGFSDGFHSSIDRGPSGVQSILLLFSGLAIILSMFIVFIIMALATI